MNIYFFLKNFIHFVLLDKRFNVNIVGKKLRKIYIFKSFCLILLLLRRRREIVQFKRAK